MNTDRLTAFDTTFLHLDSSRTPMAGGALFFFEGAPFFDSTGRFRIEDIRAVAQSRLHLVPIMRQRLAPVPLSLGRPVWVDDDQFHIDSHIMVSQLPKPGTIDEVHDLAARLMAQQLDRRRPLWEMRFIAGMNDGRIALMMRVHHAVFDGAAGLEAALVLFDLERDPPEIPAPPNWTAPARPRRRELISTAMSEHVAASRAATSAARHIVSKARLSIPAKRLVRGTKAGAGDLRQAAKSVVSGGVLPVRTPFNISVGSSRQLSLLRVPLDDVKKIRESHGGTVNDVLLTIVASGISRASAQRGMNKSNRPIRVLCPVSTRGTSSPDDEKGGLANELAAIIVSLESGDIPATDRLGSIAHSASAAKEFHQPEASLQLRQMIDKVPGPILRISSAWANRVSFVNLLASNLRGPSESLYCMGAEAQEVFLIMPLMGTLGLSVAAFSYRGVMNVALLVDGSLREDLTVLSAGIEAALAELLVAS